MKSRIITVILLVSGIISSCSQPKIEQTEPDVIKSVEIKLIKISTDPDYGYSAEKPVNVGGMAEKKGHKNQYAYLKQLTGPDGESLSFQRKGLCCMFKVDSGHRGIGFLDRWEIKNTDTGQTKTIYLNSYTYNEPQSPSGFGIKKNQVKQK